MLRTSLPRWKLAREGKLHLHGTAWNRSHQFSLASKVLSWAEPSRGEPSMVRTGALTPARCSKRAALRSSPCILTALENTKLLWKSGFLPWQPTVEKGVLPDRPSSSKASFCLGKTMHEAAPATTRIPFRITVSHWLHVCSLTLGHCLFTWRRIGARAQVRKSEDSLQESVISFHMWILDSRHLNLLSHLTSHHLCFF